jgi:hypothetical protein
VLFKEKQSGRPSQTFVRQAAIGLKGWYVEVEFSEIKNPIKPKDYMELIKPLLAEKYAPLQSSGKGLQGIYLTEISQELGYLLINLSNENLSIIENELAPSLESRSDYEIDLEVKARNIEGDLEKVQIVKSRRGQGIFKANVRLVEAGCRITGVKNIKHLIASHIKPWSDSSNSEKLDGNNGLLLSPHIDHLFDRGFISFHDSGEILVSKELNPNILQKWNIFSNKNVGEFKSQQQNYLEFHREVVFKR